MSGSVVFTLAISIALQATAALWALWLHRRVGRHAAWTLISAALLLMATRRTITLYGYLSATRRPPPDPLTEAVALAISVLMLAAVIGIGNAFLRQRETAHALHRAEDRFRLLWETSPDAILMIDRESVIRYANPGVEAQFGYPPESLVGGPLHRLQPERLRDVHVGGLRRFLATGARTLNWRATEIAVVHRDGRELPAEISFSHMKIDGEDCFAGFMRDITIRKRGEAELAARSRELARSNEELERFAYVASHDLQEPLRMVSSYLQLLARRYEGRLDAEADEFIGYAVDGAERMKALINDLLAFSRVSTRGRPFSSVDSSRALQAACENLGVAIAESGARVENDPLPAVQGDETQLVALFQNLVGNALKFRGPEPPRVRVSAARENGAWRLSVRDNGIGIDPQYFERVFVIFQRLHGRNDFPGTGIGLAVCKKIVERHGGRIWIESTPGAGATFHFTLPPAAGPARAATGGES